VFDRIYLAGGEVTGREVATDVLPSTPRVDWYL